MLPLRSSVNEAVSLAWGERVVAVRCTLRWLGEGDRAFGVSEAGVVAGIGAGEPPGLVRPRERVARPPVGEDRRRVPCRTAKPADARTKTRAAATRRRVLNEDMARGCFRVTEYPGLPEKPVDRPIRRSGWRRSSRGGGNGRRDGRCRERKVAGSVPEAPRLTVGQLAVVVPEEAAPHLGTCV